MKVTATPIPVQAPPIVVNVEMSEDEALHLDALLQVIPNTSAISDGIYRMKRDLRSVLLRSRKLNRGERNPYRDETRRLLREGLRNGG